LEEKIYEYEKNNIIVKFQEDPFAITIITPIMQRAHNLNFAKDIAFVDSTASCDSQGHSVTFMLTACGIGAVPLAVMITKGQTSDDYIAAFKLLKEAITLAFCAQGYPLQFITGRYDTTRLLFEDQLSRSAYITRDGIESIGDNLYKVIKEHGLSEFYEVNTAVGYCSCIKGKFGSFCKHQVAVFNFYKDKMPNLPAISSESRYLLAKLAIGDEVKEKEFHMPLVPNNEDNFSVTSETSFNCLPSTSNTIECHDDNNVITNNINSGSEIFQNENLAKEYKEKICSLISNNFSKYKCTSLPILSKCIQRLENVKTATGWDNFLATAGSSISLRHRSRASITYNN